jgi:hypothetical protein
VYAAHSLLISTIHANSSNFIMQTNDGRCECACRSPCMWKHPQWPTFWYFMLRVNTSGRLFTTFPAFIHGE